MINVSCNCGWNAQMPDKYDGRNGKCPNCKNAVVIDKRNNQNVIPQYVMPQIVINNQNTNTVGCDVQRSWNPIVAMLLSLFIPGAGQMYKGQVGNGIAWLIFVIIGYAVFIGLGFILHICCIIGAGMGK